MGICASPRTSERRDKEIWHRGYRRAQKRAIQRDPFEEAQPIPHFREHSNPYSFNKDGKVWIGNGGWWRRDVKKAMRK